MLAAQKHLPAKATSAKFDVDQAGTVTPGGDLNVALRQVSVQIKFAGDCGMILPGDDHERFIDEGLLPNAIADCHGNVDGQID